LAADFFIDCTEVIKDYVFAAAIHISVAEAKEKKLTEGLDLRSRNSWWKIVELELVENELCH
jgi:hypothetical protein